jgi:hypothetical protein
MADFYFLNHSKRLKYFPRLWNSLSNNCLGRLLNDRLCNYLFISICCFLCSGTVVTSIFRIESDNCDESLKNLRSLGEVRKQFQRLSVKVFWEVPR